MNCNVEGSIFELCKKSKIVEGEFNQNQHEIFIGARKGEKLYEELFAAYEMINTFETSDYFVILERDDVKPKYLEHKQIQKVTKPYISSEEPPLSLDQTINLIEEALIEDDLEIDGFR